MSSVQANTITDLSRDPDSPEAVRALGCLLTPDWSSGVSLTTTWATDIVASRTAAEQRRGIASKPTRLLNFTIVTQDRRQSWQLQQAMKRQAMSRTLVPLFTDGFDLLVDMPSARAITMPTALRRFFPGGRVVVASFEFSVERRDFAVGTIATVGANGITLAADLPRIYGRGSRVYPLIECDVVMESSFSLSSRDTGSATITAREVAGPSALPPLASYGQSLLPTYDGLPVWVPPVNFAGSVPTQGRQALFKTERLGRGLIYEPLGPRPFSIASGTGTGIDRRTSMATPRFFDSCAGSLGAFIHVDVGSAPNVVYAAGNVVAFEATGSQLDWSAIPYLAAVTSDTSAAVTGIASVTRNGDVDVVKLDESLPARSTVRRYAPARVCRFASDEQTEKWSSTETAFVDWSVVELVQERTVSMQ